MARAAVAPRIQGNRITTYLRPLELCLAPSAYALPASAAEGRSGSLRNDFTGPKRCLDIMNARRGRALDRVRAFCRYRAWRLEFARPH